MMKNIKKWGKKFMAHLIRFEREFLPPCIFLALLTIMVVIGLLSLFIEGFFFCQSDYCAHNVIALVTSDEGSKNSGMINDRL